MGTEGYQVCVVCFMQTQCFVEIIRRIFEKIEVTSRIIEVTFRIIVKILLTVAKIGDFRLHFACLCSLLTCMDNCWIYKRKTH